jgi:hypothetical protein
VLKKMKHLKLATIAVLGLTGTGQLPALADAPASMWEHNGSVVYLLATGNHREFRYSEPRQVMLEAGARSGSLLFSGESYNGEYSGTAYVFSQQCGPLPYEVSGPILDNYRTVILRGQAPRVGADCRIYGYLEDTLKFTYLRSDHTPSAIVAQPGPGPASGESEACRKYPGLC